MGKDGDGAFPAVRYRDANAAIDWLKHAFGAAEHAVYRNEKGKVQHGEIAIGAGIVMVGELADQEFLGSRGFEPWKPSISIYVVVGDPDAAYETAKASGADIVRELEDMDYGSREFSARDPEGNLWSLGTYDPRSSAE